MGQINLQLPPGLPADQLAELQRACLAGGFDNAPGPTSVEVEPRRLLLRRSLDESGYLQVPWQIEGMGRLMSTTATLMERAEPYSLPLELARGKINQVRNTLGEWNSLGFTLKPDLADQFRLAHAHFCKAVSLHPSAEADSLAQAALADVHRLIDRMAPSFTDYLFQLRQQRVPRLDTSFGCRLQSLPTDSGAMAASFNTICVNMNWRAIEPHEAEYRWDETDALLQWAKGEQIPVVAGPLIDFSPSGLPDWLWLWEQELPNLANFMCDYVETAIARYRGQVRRWQLTSAANFSSVLSLSEDEMLWLTARLAEAAMQIAPDIELVVGVSQPWGEYLAREEHTYLPLVFLDTLLRAGLRLAALDLEIAMGIDPRGSYCRDLLEISRLLDSFAVLGTPLHVSLSFPSASDTDANAESEQEPTAGYWHNGFTPETQRAWAVAVAAMAAVKPYVQGVYWGHLSDAEPHRFPNCGLLDLAGQPKPALEGLRLVREAHLR
ncbi:MAG TPA: endo-1,4-beta-xylanase [Gemmataceae bacterium]|nr:endo-1,4-beta-xylanase [Gemmataceae bacterium]